ncbi:hypothetical protein GCM10007148_00020 [Parvularcula lutaonensis]|nr:hypothetical protein GCM10007148_00020 [Parvularcula lutaonensis]
MLFRIVLATVLFASSTASARVIIVDVTGEIGQLREATFTGTDDDRSWDNKQVSSSSWYPGQTFHLGQRFRTRMRIDTEAGRGVLSKDGVQTTYLGGVTRASVAAGSYRFDLDKDTNPRADGTYSVRQTNSTGLLVSDGFHDAEGVFNSSSLFFFDRDGSSFSGFELPGVSNEIFSLISSMTLTFVFENSDQLWLQGSNLSAVVTEPNLQPVPIPASAGLFGVALAFILRKAWRSAKPASA